MSAVAALAVASPAAVVALSDLSASTHPPTRHRQFVQAAMVTDLPNELMSALSQGLSQFGINLPPMPTSLLTGSGASTPGLTAPGLTPGLTAPGLTPGLTAPGLTPGLTAPGLTPGLTAPGLTPGLTAPGLTPGLTAPGTGLPSLTGTGPGLTDPALANPALTNPALTSPAGQLPGLTTPGLTTPGLPTPGLATPGLATPGLTTPPAGIDPRLRRRSPTRRPCPPRARCRSGWIPGRAPTRSSAIRRWRAPLPRAGSGGIFGSLSSMASQLGAGQAIDLLKGMVMPAIMSAAKPAGAPAAAAALPAAAAALPAAASAIPGAEPSRASRACHETAPQNPAGSAVPLQDDRTGIWSVQLPCRNTGNN